MSELDPVLRCDSCQEMNLLETIHQIGCCSKCGNKRMRSLTIFNEQEKQQLIDWGLGSFVDEYQSIEIKAKPVQA